MSNNVQGSYKALWSLKFEKLAYILGLIKSYILVQSLSLKFCAELYIVIQDMNWKIMHLVYGGFLVFLLLQNCISLKYGLEFSLAIKVLENH